jgi:putative nucleotidyltransferase with HDIG domain
VIAGLLAATVGAHGCRLIRKRSKVLRAGAVVGLAQVACVFAATALDGQTPGVQLILLQTLSGLLSSLICVITALLLLPVFERLFNITTDITLLELSDLSHPLLQRLALEAPGTYHHSLVVANLAQAAADAIGANSLEARVCSYFHDIGKLTKPNYFAENIHMQTNPHDDLPPSMSTLVITAHVKEGISLAMLHKLPGPVMRAIREHHGSSTLSYFHHKARTQLELGITTGTTNPSDQRVDDSSFRYDGPRPSTKVSGIICLADGVEAASRSLEKTTPGHIEGLVNAIVNTRLEDGQLDLCDLKLSDLTIVKRTFVFTLSNMLHGRIPYPKDETKDKHIATGADHDSAKGEEPDAEPA